VQKAHQVTCQLSIQAMNISKVFNNHSVQAGLGAVTRGSMGNSVAQWLSTAKYTFTSWTV